MNELMIRDMRKLMILVVMLAAFALPTVAQNFEVQQPNATYQSTSTMTGSGSAYSSNPTINENGTASAPSYAPAAGQRRVSTPPAPTNDPNDSGNVPLGDAILPLMLCAVGFAGVIYVRRKRNARA